MRSIPLIGLLLGACASAERLSGLKASIAVLDKSAGCMASSTPDEVLRRQELHYDWEPVAGGYRLGERFVSDEEIAALRALLLSRRDTPPDLLARIGIDAAAIARHRDEALRTALEQWDDAGEKRIGLLPSREKRQRLPDLPEPEPEPELEQYLSYEYLAPHILAEVQGRNWGSTNQRCFRVVLPGEPAITVSSLGLVPWMLPWTVTVGAESWEVADPALSRSLLPLADPQGNCVDLLDGTSYWSTEFWRDGQFWRRWVGEPVHRARLMGEVAELAGYAAFSQRFRVQDVGSGSDYMLPESIYSKISAEGSAVIDYVRWVNLRDRLGHPTSTWNDFMALHDRATPVVARQHWLEEWKRASPGRTLWLDAVGPRGIAEDMLEELVMPAWRDAGFAGEPEYQLALSRNGDWCGTVYLSEAEGGALIETARPGEGKHWFDELDLSFHPRGKPPTYGRVDANGTFELRHMPIER